MTRNHVCFALVLLGAAVTMASRAHASGYDTARFGAERGHAATFTSLATFYNPAALAFTPDVHVSIDGALAVRGATFERFASDKAEPAGAEGANVGKAELFNVFGGPTAAGSLRLGDFTLGVGVFAPYAASARWDGNSRFDGNLDYPGTQDGVARWHLVDGSLSMLYGSVAAAYRLRAYRLSFGLSVHAVYSKITLNRASTASYDDDIRNEGRTYADVSGWTATAGLGFMWEPLEKVLWVSASYLVPPGGYGDMVLDGTLQTAFDGKVSNTDVELYQRFPDVLRWAVRYRLSPLAELRLFGDYSRWSRLERQCLGAKGEPCRVDENGGQADGSTVISNYERRWQDAFGVRFSASYFPAERWEVLAGVGYDSNAIPASTLEPSTLDGDDLAGSLGVGYTFTEHLALTLTYTYIHFLSRDTRGESRLAQLSAPSRLPDAGGKYTHSASVLDALLEVRFD